MHGPLSILFMSKRKDFPGFDSRASGFEWFLSHVDVYELEIRRYVRSRYRTVETDDIIQEAYRRLFSCPNLQEILDVRSYLYAVVRNVAVDTIRKRKAEPIDDVSAERAQEIVHDGPCSAEIASRRQELTLLRAAMAALPPRCAEAMKLHLIDGLTQRKTAEALGITERAVNSHIRNGTARIMKYFEVRGVRTHKSPPAGEANPPARPAGPRPR
jgi:RNA polymerase sigma factor (sigma-70 family)